jgi:lipopolysaccharide transport system ATP-binding protein
LTPAVRFDNVSKKFNLDIARPRSFQEIFVQRRVRAEANTFWAVQDVSFTIERGEHVGLVGTNGSGKSTLLKLMSRVLEPTSGKIEMYGRVAGLLELGTGFHPDLTGRENIFLNASILGLPRTEIKRRLEDIIEFADIGPFIDVQVRNYSSGMVVRLGFAITTALAPDVLLIDEVLAVGDADFQRKCIARLEDLQAEGVTLVFVSHGMGQVQQLCQRAIWISHGASWPTATLNRWRGVTWIQWRLPRLSATLRKWSRRPH